MTMARISEATIADVRNAAGIVDVVSQFLSLTRLGSSFRGPCPFHREKTPSFFVHPGKGIFKCFACGESGGAIQFVMKINGLDFPEAVELLANQHGITVKYEGRSNAPSIDPGIFRALEIATGLFERALHDPSNPGAVKALAYLSKRGISTDTMRLFRIGYSGGFNLLSALSKEGISPETAEKAGLMYKRSGWTPRFEDRVMFPVLNSKDQTCGFGARIVVSGTGPKYTNSQDGPAYRKGNLLYGLKHAAQGISSEKRVLVVEGYMDLLGLWEKGVRNAVATCGTALTEQHARILRRLSDNVVLFFDGDSAGIKSAVRSGGVLYAAGISPHALIPPDGKDPDDWAKELDPGQLKKETGSPVPLLQIIEGIAAKGFDLSSPGGKTGYVNLLARYLRWVNDPVERTSWTQFIARKTGFSESIVFRAQVE